MSAVWKSFGVVAKKAFVQELAGRLSEVGGLVLEVIKPLCKITCVPVG